MRSKQFSPFFRKRLNFTPNSFWLLQAAVFSVALNDFYPYPNDPYRAWRYTCLSGYLCASDGGFIYPGLPVSRTPVYPEGPTPVDGWHTLFGYEWGLSDPHDATQSNLWMYDDSGDENWFGVGSLGGDDYAWLAARARFTIANYYAVVVDPPAPSPVPLPAALPLLAVGLCGLGFIGRRKKKAS